MTEAKLRCVFVHGWGMNHAVWQPVVDALPAWIEPLCVDLPGHGHNSRRDFSSLGELASALHDEVDAPAMWVGWSLGGLAVLQLALHYPQSVKAALMVSSSPCFVAREDWPCGMPAEVFEDFAEALESDYAGTIRRFLSLQVKGSASGRRILKTLRERILQLPAANIAALRSGLSVLQHTDFRAQLGQLDMPFVWMLGAQDGLVSAALAAQLVELQPSAELGVIEKAAHAPFLSHGDVFNQRLISMAEKLV